MSMIDLGNIDEIPDEVDLSIPSCKKALLRIESVEEKEIGDSVAYNFEVKILEHDDDNALDRSFGFTFWKPDRSKAKNQQLHLANLSRWKQLFLACGLELSPEIDPNDLQGEKFYGEITQRKAKDGKSYANLGDIHFKD